jgi:starvation-inducible DNA-binding protein
MSPTSYQTAPPRSSIIATTPGAVKPRVKSNPHALANTFTMRGSFLRFRGLVSARTFSPFLRYTKKLWHPVEDGGIQAVLIGMLNALKSRKFSKSARTRRSLMAKKEVPASRQSTINAQPRLHQRAGDIQAYGTVSHGLPLELEEPVRLEMTEQLNLLLADTMTLRDLYKKSHWQVAGPTFYQLHLLFDKHYDEQVEVVDEIAERIQLLGGVSLAMAADVAETTRIERPPRGREEVPVQISRLLDAHQIIIGHCRQLAERATQLGDAGTNDLVVSDVLRPNELQVWFLSEHLVDVPLVHAVEPGQRKAG